MLIPEKLSMANHQVWMTEDLPLEMKCEKSFLFGLKRLLMFWGWTGFETKVELESGSVFIDGHLIVHMKVM